MSKITDGFEHKWNVRYGKNAGLVGLTYELLIHARALEAMLKELESCSFDKLIEINCCPVCGELRGVTQHHSPDCALAKLLE